MTPETFTIASLRERLDKGDISVEKVFEQYHKKITAENPELNAYLTIFDKPTASTGGVLAGVPCAIKDNILIEGTRATGASKILDKYISAYDATVIKKLRAAGATFLGKTNMDEFAMGSSTENSAYGPTLNPLDHTRIPGGTSGGSAAAVAADLAVFALGSDTGGSVRQPAAMCGIVGLKPSYGRVSRHGLMATASSLDQIGTLTKTVADAATVLNVIAGHDVFDSTTVPLPETDFATAIGKPIKGMRVGVPKEFFGAGLSAEVSANVKKAIAQLESLGCTIHEITIPNFSYGLAAYYVINACEISANLARYDGIRYGYSAPDAATLLDTYVQSRSQALGPEPKRRIMLGAYALSSGYYDAYYLKAQKVRALIKKDFETAFKDVDVIVGPTTPNTAFKLGEKMADPLSLYLEDIYTVTVNLIGAPAISIPCGRGADTNMPVGFQIIGKQFDEVSILAVAHALEQTQ